MPDQQLCRTSAAWDCPRQTQLAVAGSDRGGERAAAIYTLTATAKLNDVDPQAWLEDVLRRVADHRASGLADLLAWNWQPTVTAAALKKRHGLAVTSEKPAGGERTYRLAE